MTSIMILSVIWSSPPETDNTQTKHQYSILLRRTLFPSFIIFNNVRYIVKRLFILLIFCFFHYVHASSIPLSIPIPPVVLVIVLVIPLRLALALTVLTVTLTLILALTPISTPGYTRVSSLATAGMSRTAA